MDHKDLLAVNPLLTDRTRLAILSLLVAENAPVDFNTTLEKLGLSRGNLSVHVQKMEEGGLVRIAKKFVGKIPLTTYESTPQGRQELEKYMDTIGRILAASLKEK